MGRNRSNRFWRRFSGNISALCGGGLIFPAALFPTDVVPPGPSHDSIPLGRPVSGGKALIYYGETSAPDNEALFLVALPVLLFSVLIALAAYRVIRNNWNHKD